MGSSIKKRLTRGEAVESWLYLWDGRDRQWIARVFGVNTFRIYEVWREDVFVGSREEAASLAGRQGILVPPRGSEIRRRPAAPSNDNRQGELPL
jgi:hypothetical protein